MNFGYWNIRGLAEPIRYLLHHKKADFVDKRYTLGEEEWSRVKFTLGLDFPNLPYLFDGDVKLTQSTAILRYLAQKYKLDGNTRREKLRVTLAEQQLIDLRSNYITIVYSSEFESEKPAFVQSVPANLKLFEDFIGDGVFICGDNVTYVDFMLAEIYDFHTYLMPEILKDFPVLKAHRDRVFNLPGLREYRDSASYKQWPINGPMASFGGAGEEPRRE